MTRIKKLVLTIAALAALGAGGAAIAGAVGGDESSSAPDNPAAVNAEQNERHDGEATATGAGADQATKAALAITGGGTANAVERDGENGATWEVEVTKPDGNTVDVRLDEQYQLVVVEGDNESE